MKERFISIIQNSTSVKKAILQNSHLMDIPEKIIGVMVSSFKKGKRIYFCGNGGSAADAQHLAAEFNGRFYTDRLLFLLKLYIVIYLT